jgi:hypothetical protein
MQSCLKWMTLEAFRYRMQSYLNTRWITLRHFNIFSSMMKIWYPKLNRDFHYILENLKMANGKYVGFHRESSYRRACDNPHASKSLRSVQDCMYSESASAEGSCLLKCLVVPTGKYLPARQGILLPSSSESSNPNHSSWTSLRAGKCLASPKRQ